MDGDPHDTDTDDATLHDLAELADVTFAEVDDDEEEFGQGAPA